MPLHYDETSRILQLLYLSEKEEKSLYFASDYGQSRGNIAFRRFETDTTVRAIAKGRVFTDVGGNSEVKTKQEIKENLRELSAAEERIKALDKIIQSLYEDKVAGILSEERYLKLSDTYETEQADLTEKAQMLKAEIEKDKKEKDEILDFLCLVEKYSSIEELTPEIIRSFVDRIIVHEKRKENGHYRQEIEIVYNFIGAVEFPDFLDDDEYDGLSC